MKDLRKEVFKQAAEIIKERGLLKGELFSDAVTTLEYFNENKQIKCCVNGALTMACTGQFTYEAKYDKEYYQLYNDCRDILSSVIGGKETIKWNDDEKTTAEDVVKALNKAAAQI